MPDRCELAWLGGFFSGEGTAHVTKPRESGRVYLQLSVTNSDLGALRRFQRAFGGRVNARMVRVNLPLYEWRLAKQDESRASLEQMLPWLTDSKAAQAQRCLEALDAQPPVDTGRAWRARRERFGPSGGNVQGVRC